MFTLRETHRKKSDGFDMENLIDVKQAWGCGGGDGGGAHTQSVATLWLFLLLRQVCLSRGGVFDVQGQELGLL